MVVGFVVVVVVNLVVDVAAVEIIVRFVVCSVKLIQTMIIHRPIKDILSLF